MLPRLYYSQYAIEKLNHLKMGKKKKRLNCGQQQKQKPQKKTFSTLSPPYSVGTARDETDCAEWNEYAKKNCRRRQHWIWYESGKAWLVRTRPVFQAKKRMKKIKTNTQNISSSRDRLIATRVLRLLRPPLDLFVFFFFDYILHAFEMYRMVAFHQLFWSFSSDWTHSFDQMLEIPNCTKWNRIQWRSFMFPNTTNKRIHSFRICWQIHLQNI